MGHCGQRIGEQNKLVSLTSGLPAQVLVGTVVQYRQAPGYPLYGLWARRMTYSDANHDRIIEPGEVTLADSATYIGPSLPTREGSVGMHSAVGRGTIVLAGLLDYRGGYRIANAVAVNTDFVGSSMAANIPTAPLWLQARAVDNAATLNANAFDYEDSSFVRVREVSATVALPEAVGHTLRLWGLSLTAAVRNLALWTRYTGGDPEVSNTNGENIAAAQSLGVGTVNNNVREDFGAVPLLRYWVLRLNASL